MNKTTIYFIFLILFLIAGIYQLMNFQSTQKHTLLSLVISIWALIVFITMAWSKKEFTGKKWFEKAELKSESDQPLFNTQFTNKVHEKNYQYTAEQEIDGYTVLTKLCLAQEDQKSLIAFFKALKDFSQDEHYMTTLNYVMEYCDEQNLFFIMSLDWKQDIETLEWRLKNAITENFNLDIALPNPKNYDSKASISYDNVLDDYDRPLRSEGLQIGFIDTESDEYVLIIHKSSDKSEVQNAIMKIGYSYYEVKHNNK